MTQVVGRRTALRYLAVGMGASVLAACGKNSDSEESTGPFGQAVRAFVRGKWRVDPVGEEGERLSYWVEVEASSWTVQPIAQVAAEQEYTWKWKGQRALQGSNLSLQYPFRPDEPELDRQATALNVPGKIGEAESLRLPWRLSGGGSPKTDELRVKYAKGRLHIVHINDGRLRSFTCTRV